MTDFCPHCNPCRKIDKLNEATKRIADLEHALRLIAHATATGDDGGYHENAFSIASAALAAREGK